MLDIMQIDALTQCDAEDLVNLLLRKFAPELEGFVKIQWNNRFSRVMGQAYVSEKLGVCLNNIKFNYHWLIKFSTKLWTCATEDERRETIIHEVAHIIQFYRALSTGKKIGNLKVGNGHQEDWQCIMREIGYKQPKRFHNVGYSAYCTCREHKLTAYQYKKIKKGTLRCKFCRDVLTVERSNMRENSF